MTSKKAVGALAAAVALAFLWLLSGLFGSIPFIPSTASDLFIRATPGDVATFFIEKLGHWAKLLLTVGGLVVAVAAGGAAVHRFGIRIAAGIAAVVSIVVVIFAPGQMSLLPAILGVLATAAVFAGASRSLLAPALPGEADAEAVDLGRRRVLRMGVGTAAGIAAGGAVAGWIARRLGGPNTDVAIADPVVEASIPNRDGWPDIPGLTPEITSVADHYVVDINFVQPTVEVEGWTLAVKGAVENPTSLTFTQLQSDYEVVEEYSVLCCVSNEVGGDLVGHSAWRGVRLADVLQAAGPTIDSGDVVFRAADGYSDSIPLELALDPSVLLAFAQNGEPLEQGHGFPCRVRIPAIYGMKNVKWLESIEVVKKDYIGYWQKRGWSDIATVVTESRIDVVESPSSRQASWVAGIAWAGDRGISRVEVSTDDGATWNEARVREPISRFSWSQWAYEWTPSRSGKTTVVVRATDGTGETQTEDERPPHPAGATGWHRVTTTVA